MYCSLGVYSVYILYALYALRQAANRFRVSLPPEVDRIRVFVRIRPLNDDEVRRGDPFGFETIKERNEVSVLNRH